MSISNKPVVTSAAARAGEQSDLANGKLNIAAASNSLEAPITGATPEAIQTEAQARASSNPIISNPALRMAFEMRISYSEFTRACFKFDSVKFWSTKKLLKFAKRLEKTERYLVVGTPKQAAIVDIAQQLLNQMGENTAQRTPKQQKEYRTLETLLKQATERSAPASAENINAAQNLTNDPDPKPDEPTNGDPEQIQLNELVPSTDPAQEESSESISDSDDSDGSDGSNSSRQSLRSAASSSAHIPRSKYNNQIADWMIGDVANDQGIKISTVFKYSLTQLEDMHDYIQYLFPIWSQSKSNKAAPILTQDVVQLFKDSQELRNVQVRALDMMLSFFGLDRFENSIHPQNRFTNSAHAWLETDNHNALRITRMIKSLHALGNEELAKSLQTAVIGLGEGKTLSEKTINFWKEANKEMN